MGGLRLWGARRLWWRRLEVSVTSGVAAAAATKSCCLSGRPDLFFVALLACTVQSDIVASSWPETPDTVAQSARAASFVQVGARAWAHHKLQELRQRSQGARVSGSLWLGFLVIEPGE